MQIVLAICPQDAEGTLGYAPGWMDAGAKSAQWPNEGAENRDRGNSEVLFGSPVSSCQR